MTNYAFGPSQTPHSWRSCVNPLELPDPPTMDNVKDMKEYWQSDCCHSDVMICKNDSIICQSCGRFCIVDPVLTVEKYDKEEGAL